MNGGAKNERRREVQLLLWSAEGDNSESLCEIACALRPAAVCRTMGALDYLGKPDSYDDYVKVAAEIKMKAGI